MNRFVLIFLVALPPLLTGCLTAAPVEANFKAEFRISKRTHGAVKKGDTEYLEFGALIDEALSYPIPGPRIEEVVITNPPPNINDLYAPLLSFIQSGPQGQQITLSHLKQITPTALALAASVTNTTTVTQFLYSPQALQFAALAKSILQPLGLWNTNVMWAWINYMAPNAWTYNQVANSPKVVQLLGILIDLRDALIAAGNYIPTTTTITTEHYVNPIEVLDQINELLQTKQWLLIGEIGPGLAGRIIKAAGYKKRPLIFLHGSRSNYWRPALTAERVKDGKRESLTLGELGFRKNKGLSGADRLYQGPDDISLTYIPIKIKNKSVTTLDLIPSERFMLLKKAAGGDTNLIDRVPSQSTGLVQLNLDLLRPSVQARMLWGSTTRSQMGGAMVEVGTKSTYFDARIGGGALLDSAYDSSFESVIGFLDLEAQLRTPSLTIADKSKSNRLRVWVSNTVSMSALADRPISSTRGYKTRDLTFKWGFQGDARLIPEVNLRLDTPFFSVRAFGGTTAAVAPGGSVDLARPEKSVGVYFIRYHVGGEWSFNLSRAINVHYEDRSDPPGLKTWWTPAEKQAYLEMLPPAAPTVGIPLRLRVGGVGEFSAFSKRGRMEVALDASIASLAFLTEVESDELSPITDIRLGVGGSVPGLYFRYLQSAQLDDMRLEFGLDLGQLAAMF